MPLRPLLLAALFVGCSFPYEVGTRAGDASACGEIPDGAVLSCGICGRVPCVDGAYTGCIEPENKPGTSCGTCGTSVYACTAPGTVDCTKQDDRTTDADLSALTVAGSETDNRTFTRRTQLAASYAAQHTGEITSVRFLMRKYATTTCGYSATNPPADPACGNCVSDGAGGFNCTVVMPVTPGVVTLSVFRGTPPSMLEAMPVATVELDPAKVPDMLASPVDFVLTSPVAVKAGDAVTFVLGIDSTSTGVQVTHHRDRLAGMLPLPHKTWNRSVYPPAAWTEQVLRSQVAIEVSMKGCFATD